VLLCSCAPLLSSARVLLCSPAPLLPCSPLLVCSCVPLLSTARVLLCSTAPLLSSARVLLCSLALLCSPHWGPSNFAHLSVRFAHAGSRERVEAIYPGIVRSSITQAEIAKNTGLEHGESLQLNCLVCSVYLVGFVSLLSIQSC
jgi:hypothetical protein